MKFVFILDRFPVFSETFILSQITGLIDLGVDIDIISIYQGDLVRIHNDFIDYQLLDRVTYLLPKEPEGKIRKLTSRLVLTAKALRNKRMVVSLIKMFQKHWNSNLVKRLTLPSAIHRLDSRNEYNLIMAHFGPAGVAANILRDSGLLTGKLATVFHGYDITSQAILKSFQYDYQQLFSNGDLFLPISELWANKLKILGCPAEKIKVHHMGVDISSFTLKPAENNNNKARSLKILTVARFAEKKGIEYAVRAVCIAAETVNIQYWLAGSGELESQVSAWVTKYDKTGCINLMGFQNQEQIKTLLQRSDLFLQPSITAKSGDMEGIPVAMMEAMASGVVPVSTYHSGIPELVEHGVSGLLAEEKDYEKLAILITMLAEQPELLNPMKKAAREKVNTAFNVKKLNIQLLGYAK